MTKVESKTEFVVVFADRTGEDRYGHRLTLNAGQQLYEAAKKSPLRKGRGVMLSEVTYYRNDCGDWEVGENETVDGEGGGW